MKIKILLGVILLVSAIFCAYAGQYFGGYVFLRITHIDLSYLTVSTLSEYKELYANDKQVMKYISAGTIVSWIITLFPWISAIVIYYKSRQKEELHGSARFANDAELKKSGLLEETGKMPEILLGVVAEGKYKGKYIRFRGQQFVGLEAPTRSGKGVGIVIPNLVNYPDSVINSDIKLENFRKTAGFRQSMGQEVFLFSPDGFALDAAADRESGKLRCHRYNPLSYIRRNAIYRIGDILTITSIFYPITGDGKSDIWNELAGKLCKGLILFMLDNEDIGHEVSFAQMLRLTTPEGGLKQWMKDQIEIDKISEECKAEFHAFIDAAKETASSVVSNLIAPLAIFSDKVCAAATSGDDFDLREIRRKRMTVYVGVQPANIKKFSKLLNLFWSQLISINTDVLPEDDHTLKYQCLLAMDEFTALGRVDIIQHAIGFTAGYNIRFLLIYQSIAQLEDNKSYGKEGSKVLLDNLAVKIIYPPKEVDQHVKNLSETLGYKTVKHKSNSRTNSINSTSRTASDKEDKRALMLPQEIKELSFEKKSNVGLKELIVMENMRAFICNKIIYFDEEIFQERVEYSLNNIPEIPLLDLSKGNVNLPITINDEVITQTLANETIKDNSNEPDGQSESVQVKPIKEYEDHQTTEALATEPVEDFESFGGDDSGVSEQAFDYTQYDYPDTDDNDNLY